MAGDAANIVLGAVTERVITPVVDAIGRHLGYLFCYKSNIKNLGKIVTQFEKSSNDADSFFKGQKRNNEETAQSSVGWLEDAKKMIKDAKEVEEATAKLKGCLNVKGQYVLSRKSTKLAAEILTLQNKAPKGITTNIVLPAGRLPGVFANYTSKGYKTRMQTIDEVMKVLEDQAINVIGICGLGGVGKTTMVHEVRERARKQNLFDEVAMTTVSQNHDLLKIQGDLAEMLGLCFKETENVIARADQLNKRLASCNKVLVILDDVWSDINLKNVGIPFGSGDIKCKVVITSRQEGVCTNIQKNIKVHVLATDEARALFRTTAGECVEINNLEKIADEIADECRGLPIALLTISRALSNKDVRAWEDARTRLREGNATSIHGMEKEVYQSIKLSYDFLAMENQHEAQSLLLLCCQHQEDAKINVEKLTRYCLSLDLFEGVTGVVRARNRVYTLIEHLKSCFLLQAVESDKEFDSVNEREDEAVKVHDVVRDVCLSMVSRNEANRDKVYMQIMEQETYDSYKIGTSQVDYPKIKLLMMPPYASYHPTLSFQQMDELRVLENFPWDGLSLNPFFFRFLTNLRMLSFESGPIHPHTMLELPMLMKLEILSFLGSSFESLPCKILGQLRNLKLLDLRCSDWYSTMTPFPSGILPGLTKLEELYMGNYGFAEKAYGNNGAVNEGVRDQACISELDSLPNLTTLQFHLLDTMGLLELKHLCFDKLERFSFGKVGIFETSYRSSYISLCPLVLKTLELKNIGIKWVSEDKIQSIIRRTVDLCLIDIRDWTDPLIIERFSSLRKLEMTRCNQLEYIIHDGNRVDNAIQSRGSPCNSSSVFKNLEILMVREMSNVRELCHNGNLLEGSLYKLHKLHLENLPIMRNMWVGPNNPRCFENLRELEILGCQAIESIFLYSTAKCLVHLEGIKICDCLQLKGIVSKVGERATTGREAEITEQPNDLLIHFPKLRHVNIEESPDLRGFYNLDDGIGQPLFNPLVMLPSIEKLEVNGLHQLKQIMVGEMLDIPTFSAANWLQNLQSLNVDDCESLESVFDFEGKQVMGEENTHVVTLSILQRIKLSSLPKLRHIFGYTLQYISVPELRDITVSECDSLVNLFASNFIKELQNLNHVRLQNCELIEVVFDFEGLVLEAMTMGEDARSLLHKLEWIHLVKLPKLERLCMHVPKEVHIFKNLTRLAVVDCGGLAYLIPSSIAHMLVNLQWLSVTSCKGMKEVISKTNEDSGELGKKIVFRSLCHVRLEDLENLSSFCSSNQQVIEFPSLERVSIIQCPEIDTFCCQIPRVFRSGMLEGNVSKKLLTDLVAQFPKLKEVILQGTPNCNDNARLLPLCHPLVTLPSMETLEICGRYQLKQIVGGEMLLDFSSIAASDCLNNLRKLVVRGCDSLELVFDFEGKQIMGENAHVVKLGKLQKVMLSRLPNLTHIFRGRVHDVSTPELRFIRVTRCDSLVSLAASNFLKLLQNLKQVRLDNCKAMKVVLDFEGFKVTSEDEEAVLGKLETVCLKLLPNLEHICRQVPKEINGFQNLSSLTAYGCDSLSYLLTSTMAHMLVNLKRVIVWKCKSMKEVIKMDCVENKIVFLSMRRIVLYSSEKLSSFCSSKLQEFAFPLLDQVKIVKCRAMKTFCCGHLTAKKLRGVYFDNSTLTHEDDENDNDDDNENEDDDDVVVRGDADGDDYDDDVDNYDFDDDDDGKVVWKSDVNETICHFNSRVTPISCHLSEDDVDNEYDQCGNKGTSSKLRKALLAPLIVSFPDASSAPSELPRLIEFFPSASTEQSAPSGDFPPRPVSINNEELAYISSQDLRKVALPRLIEFFPSASTEQSALSGNSPRPVTNNDEDLASLSGPDLREVALHHATEFFPSAIYMEQSTPSGDSPVQITADKLLFELSLSSPDDEWKRSRIFIQDVYVKSEMKTTFEEILVAKPNFLSGLRLKRDDIKTLLVESAIQSLQILRNCSASSIASEQLAYIRDSLHDLVFSGLDMGWLERGYHRASLVLEEQKAVSAAAELARLEREETEYEAAFEVARTKLETSRARKDAFKAEYVTLMQELEARKEAFGSGFDMETSLADGLLD